MTHTARIYCPECGCVDTFEANGPAHPKHMPTTTAAEHQADAAVRRHCGEVESFRDEIHHPILFTESGARRLEPEVSEFVN